MAYSTSNPPRCISQSVGANGGDIWFYNSADAATVVRINGYITNAGDLGMKVGDIVMQSDLANATVAHMYVLSGIDTAGAGDLSNGTAILTTNTD